MIIYGGEPPHIEKPEPRFGEVILRLDQMTYAVEQKVHSFNEGTKDSLILFTQNLADFITSVVVPIDAHLNAKGAVHGETQASIGLSKKDNYRTATVTEQGNLVPVDAYVTPQGAKQAFVNRNNDSSFVNTDYQQNDVLQFASYYYVNEFPVITPTVVQPPRYLQQSGEVGMIMNDDRIVYSPLSDRGVYQTDVGFISSPTNNRKSSQLTEILNLQTRFLPAGWNTVGGVTADGKVALFKPLVDKKIYVYKDALGEPAGGRNFLLYGSFVGTVYKGLSVLPTVTDDFTFKLSHKFFRVNAFDTDPTLVDLITASYPCLYTLLGTPPYQAALQQGHSYDIRKFVTLSPGQTIKIGAVSGTPKVTVGLAWAAEDREIYIHVTVPVVVTGGGVSKFLMVNFLLSLIPGNLLAGGSATMTMLGTLTPDTIDPTLTPAANSQRVSVADPWDLNSPGNLPGVVLRSGDILRSISTRNGIRVKRYPSGFAGLKAWMEGPRPQIHIRNARSEMYTVSRHSPFGYVPERIIPLTNVNEITRYLVYGLDNERGRYQWAEVTWNTESIVGNVVGARFGIRSPAVITPYPWIDSVPRGLSIYASKSTGGFVTNSLVFTTENGYKASSTFGYAQGVVTVGPEVKLSPTTLLQLQTAGKKVMINAKALNPAIPDEARELQIQVFALVMNKAVAIVSDGYSYAEGVVLPYSVSNGIFTLNPIGSNGIVLQRLTPASNTLTGVNRGSKSGDGVWSAASDLLASQVDSTTYDIAVTKPFGAVYGDLSFRVGSLNNDLPTLTAYSVNPARLYAGVSMIDVVDELHPAILIAAKGVYQVTPGSVTLSTVMREVNTGASTVDPYDINETGWVHIPAGSRIVLMGRVYVLNRDYPVKVKASGTSYCYLRRFGNELVAISSDVMREVKNNEVMFGISVNGILTANESYVVMNNHVLRTGRRGSAIPMFEDDGGLGTNKFFTRRDVS